jgi:hypothetical protein
VPSTQTTKELLKDIVGTLGIDGYGARLAVECDGIGKQLVSILIDLFGNL